MRLWSLHPKYLDAAGLVALWREGLLGRAVLQGATRGYRHHPQLERFRAAKDPLLAIEAYLAGVFREARRRGFCFDPAKVDLSARCGRLPVTFGQLGLERALLLRKLARRSPDKAAPLRSENPPRPHPLFRPVPGPRASWEKSRLGLGMPDT